MSLTLNMSGKNSILRTIFSPPILLEHDSEICLLSLIFWNSIPNVSKHNQNFYYDDKVIEIPEGAYELENIEEYLIKNIKKKPMSDEEKLILGDVPLILYGNRQTLKSEMICRYDVDFSKPNNIGQILGFSERIVPALQRAESDRTVNILSTEVIRVNCSLSTSSYHNRQPVHMVHEFFPQAAPGFKVVEVPNNLIYHRLNSRIIPEIEITLTDQDDNLVNLKGESIHARFHIKPI